MPNLLDATGLQTATRAELVAYFTTKYQEIYGPDINLASNTPDGQMLNIFVQSILDLEDLLVQVYNMFDPDNAVGVVLDQRVAINGIQRQAGTFTVTPVTVVNSGSVNLYGLDQTIQPVYTVSDNAGNLWQLQDTQLGLAAGTHSLSFQAAVPGAQLTIPNTITTQVTIVLGVTTVNNPTTYTTLGVNEEPDAVLKVRRQQSVSLSSQGYLAGLLAALLNVDGVDSAFVYENDTSVTDGDGVPGHTIWVIVSGSATDADIAQAIYSKRNAGAGMFGDQSYVITQVDSTLFTVYWDASETQQLFIEFTATSLDGVTEPNIAAIRAGLVTNFAPEVNAEVNINQLATLVQEIDPNTLVTDAGFSTGASQTLTLSGVAASGTFKLAYNGEETTALNWNDSVGTIQTALQALTGLNAATVTGSIASQSLVADLSLSGEILGLITAVDNTLATVGPVDITFAYDEDLQNKLSPTSKKNQFIVSEANIIILPMILSPTTSSIDTSASQQMTGLGGYGDYLYEFDTNASGGTIDPGTGEYTAGGSPGTDILKVTDSMGNTALATVAVS